MNPRLRIETGTLRGREFELSRAFVVGRAQSCDLVLSDDSCSRLHARFTPEGDRVKLEDLGSTNGTLVNGERKGLHILEEGDRITIGDTSFLYRRGEFDATKTVILSSTVRDTATIASELALDPKPKDLGTENEARLLAAFVQLLDATRGVPEVHAIGRAICQATSDLLETSRASLLLFRPGSADPRDALQMSIPDMRFDPARPWVGRALLRRRALLLEDQGKAAKGSKNSVHGLVIPAFEHDRPIAMLYADRRGREFNPAEFGVALQLFQGGIGLLQTAILHERIRGELAEHRARSDAERRLVGQSDAHRATIQSVRSWAAKDEQAVLFIGETGTGKELLARLLHDASPRREGPFYTVNCSATPANVLEIELFGSVGSLDSLDRETSLERASGGTLFLDEIDALDLPTQARLAAVLRSGRLSREPGGREVSLNVRLVAASDRDLAQLATDGSFHEELLALLAMATIKIPPLRERADDIPLFADHFLKLHSRRMNRHARRITSDALRMLAAYSWPGNVRELSNVIERAVMLCRDDEIGPEILPFTGDQAVTERELSLDHVEKIAILRALNFVQGKKGQAAKVLGISWPTLNKKIHDYGIEVPEKT